MRRPYQILIPLLSLFLARVDLTDIYPLKIEAQILKVIDGDTLWIKSGAREFSLRLMKLDAPEKPQLFLNGRESAGLYSQNCLKRLIKNKRVVSLYKLDIYGRVLGEIGNVSLEMIENGCAVLYPYTVFDSRKEKSLFLQAEAKARKDRKGLWGRGGILSPKLFRAKKRI
ncbi:MAG: thermonuclease family protein [Bacteriovoracaceae bacterium]